jgi:hypothetical protein
VHTGRFIPHMQAQIEPGIAAHGTTAVTRCADCTDPGRRGPNRN